MRAQRVNAFASERKEEKLVDFLTLTSTTSTHRLEAFTQEVASLVVSRKLAFARLVSSLDTGLARAQRRRKASRSQTEPAVCGEGERDLCVRERATDER